MKEDLIKAAKRYMVQLDAFEDQAILEQIESELDEILALNEPKVLEKRLKYVGIGTLDDYLNKWIETREGPVLAGIRHLGGNLEEPFIYLWPSFKIVDLKGIVEDVKVHFEIFKPKTLKFWVRPDSNTYEVDIMQQRFIGLVETMIKHDFDLEKPSDYYAWYEYEYKKFHEMNPDYVDRITVNSKELMDYCQKEGWLFFMKDDDKIIGLIAGEPELFLGEKAVYVDEILVSNAYRGKGYAIRLLGSFVNALDVRYLTCHIDSHNIASTKTAIRSGQRIFSQECSTPI